MTTVLIMDLDNTVYDFVHVHAKSFRTLIHIVSKETGISEADLKERCRGIAKKYGSLDLQDYIFDLLLEMPEVSGRGEDFEETLRTTVRVGFDRTRRKYLRPYSGIKEALRTLNTGGVQIVALSNAPFAISYYRLSQMDIRSSLSGLIAWEGAHFDDNHPNRDKRISQLQRRVRAASASLAVVETLTREQLKPDSWGFEKVGRHYGADARFFAVGDSISKDLTPAKSIGATTVWAKYGTQLDQESLATLLEITPWTTTEVAKHTHVDVEPDHVISNPSELLSIVPHARQQELF